jgi:hypothetical protein
VKDQSKSLKIGKGDKAKKIEFKYAEPEGVNEMEAAVAENIAKGVLSDKVTALKIFNYGLDLKVRAKVKEQNTETGVLTKQRQRTTAWVMSPNSGGEDFRTDLITHLTSGDTKGLNDYLDDLYETEQEAVDGWKPSGV